MIFLTTIYPSCRQASSYFGVDFYCNHHDQIVYVKNTQEYVYYPLTKNGTALNQYMINLTYQISNINNKYFLNSIVRKYKRMPVLNKYNLKIDPFYAMTYLLDYRQLTGDNVELITSVTTIQSDIVLPSIGTTGDQTGDQTGDSTQNNGDNQNTNITINQDITQLLNQIIINIGSRYYKVDCRNTINIENQPLQCLLKLYSESNKYQDIKGYITFFYNLENLTISHVQTTQVEGSSSSQTQTQQTQIQIQYPQNITGHISYLQTQNDYILSGDINYKMNYISPNTDTTDNNAITLQYTGIPKLYLETLYQKEAPHNLNFSRIGVHTLGWQIILIGALMGVLSIVFTLVIIIQYRNSLGGMVFKQKTSKSKLTSAIPYPGLRT